MKPVPRLVAITPEEADVVWLLEWVDRVGRSGCDGVILRTPNLRAPEVHLLALHARDRVRVVIVHERSAGAIKLVGEGFGLHLRDHPVDRKACLLGVSCHDAAGVEARLAEGAHYVLFSPVWSPTSKPDDTRPTLGLERYLEVARGRPVLALGGVTPERHRELRARGGWGSAVMGGLARFVDDE